MTKRIADKMTIFLNVCISNKKNFFILPTILLGEESDVSLCHFWLLWKENLWPYLNYDILSRIAQQVPQGDGVEYHQKHKTLVLPRPGIS